MTDTGLSPCNNNNISSKDEHQLLIKLQEANRQLEADEKSLQSLGPVSSNSWLVNSNRGHVRKCSSSSVGSSTSSHSSAPDEDEAATNESLWEIWGRIVHEWDTVKKKTAFLRELVRHGIPPPLRSIAWQLLTNACDAELKSMYAELLGKNSPSEKQIRRDIARTFPDHDFFKDKDGVGQESLFNVMKAYSLQDREVGYCQGSCFIVGLLLMQMPEEEAFAVFVRLMQNYRLREIYKPNMKELGLYMFQLENIIQELLPEIHAHFNSQAFHTSMYASTWFLTLFVTCLPLTVALRIMDLFVLEGVEIVFRIGMAILTTHKDELLSMDMEGMIHFFQKELSTRYATDMEADALIHDAYQVRYNSKKLKRLEKDYTVRKSKEDEDQIELRRLRTENRLLRQRIDNLEAESSDLADKLISHQVIRAQEAEDTFVLKNELSAVRQKIAQLTEKLNKSAETIDALEHEKCNPSLESLENYPLVTKLRQSLADMRQKDGESAATIEELQMKIASLHDANKELQRAPTNDIQQIQEELIAAKLREAESNLALKEIRQRVHELDNFWQKHFEASQSVKVSPTSGILGKDKLLKQEVKAAEEELMTIRLREAQTLSELKDSKLKIMDLETQNQICSNQIRRLHENNETYQQKLQMLDETFKEQNNKIRELERVIADMETKEQEVSMMRRIKEMEDAQLLESLRQKIAQLEIDKDELSLYKREASMEERVGKRQLRDEDIAEKNMPGSFNISTNSMSSSMMSSSMMISMDEDDLAEAIASTDTLNRTLSDIIEGVSSPAHSLDHFGRSTSPSQDISHISPIHFPDINDNCPKVFNKEAANLAKSLYPDTIHSDLQSSLETQCVCSSDLKQLVSDINDFVSISDNLPTVKNDLHSNNVPNLTPSDMKRSLDIDPCT